ncbi:hypothetical protein BD777DRAFT_128739 [Yarrowia lipolytica]|nr:hypothetical protein BD777DRAFT_128739 [Yarrowia lipolytica]
MSQTDLMLRSFQPFDGESESCLDDQIARYRRNSSHLRSCRYSPRCIPFFNNSTSTIQVAQDQHQILV